MRFEPYSHIKFTLSGQYPKHTHFLKVHYSKQNGLLVDVVIRFPLVRETTEKSGSFVFNFWL